MTVNMGTPHHPERVPHWSAKELIAHSIRSSFKAAISRRGRHYGAATNRDLDTLSKVVPSISRHWSTAWPYWYVAYAEQPHDGCEGGLTVVDLIREAGKGEVRTEDDWLAFRPDIAIYRDCEVNPAFALEVVDTSQPSQNKLSAYKTEGIEAYKVNVKAKGNLRTALKYNPFAVEPMASTRCGQALRDTVDKVVDHWKSLPDPEICPWIGYCHYPTNTKEYGYGGANPDLDCSWGHVPSSGVRVRHPVDVV